MSWTNRTLAMMADTVIRPLFILRTIAVNNAPGVAGYTAARSEERRVGKEC